MADEREPVEFLSINQFKERVGASELEVLHNPKTGKLFMSANGENYKVQGDIDSNKPMKVLVPKAGIQDSCLINPSAGAETKFVL